MTELEVLIAEQEKDAATYRVWSTSIDAFPSGADLVHVRRRGTVTDDRHGTLNCYTNLACRCAKCRAVSAEAKREQRRRKRVDKGPYSYRLCCQDCGGGNVRRERVYEAGGDDHAA